MHRCACSSRALELFVQDFAGLSLRQQPAQRYFQRARGYPSQRTFGTNIRSRHLETTSSTGMPDHELLPFDFEAARAGKDTCIPAPAAEKNSGEEKLSDWHAELEILHSKERDIESDAWQRGSPEKLSKQEAPQVSTRDAESIALHASSPNTEPPVTASDTLDTTHESSTARLHFTVSADSQPLSVKTEPRLNRKARRMAAGIYKPSAQVTVENTEESEYEMVISKIRGMEGLMPHIPRPVQVRERKAVRIKEQSAHGTQAEPKHKREPWQVQKAANKEKFGATAWTPRKRLSPDTLEGIRALHASDPSTYPTEMLADHFKVTPEAIRRILKSKWQPSDFEREDRSLRWERRGVKKWGEMSELGVKPPRRWRELGVGSVKGQPEEKPTWKGGSHRPREKRVPMAEGDRHEDELADRIL
ncbi:hypothetical protein K431DRAFT_288132 [Polychaeton citri CBS 116435]|uniref:Required for respiratory growth protein 9, mitochondrial n=1 Tax=Polychaeton citri CBS 116435 TaxID=1314669 RepID=A0A9P4Q1Z7_9PEZI|nr:hypothetical protein K431DRAFT_288132 [Polychaeton citri CBS 116435]